jgi:inhibitor of KinA sporulation pathway (predicted exonuclease)
MNYNHLCIFDFETGDKFIETADIIQIGALMLDPRTLSICDKFYSNAKPPNFDNVKQEALDVNHITKEEIEKAPDIKLVWEQFVSWVNRFNRGSGTFTAPIPCGFNIIGFDLKLVDKYSKLYGPFDEKRNQQKLFNQVNVFDIFHNWWYWTENNPEITKLKLSITQEYMGVDKAEAELKSHNALYDCEICHRIMQKLFNASRYLTQVRKETGTARLQFKGCLSTQKE